MGLFFLVQQLYVSGKILSSLEPPKGSVLLLGSHLKKSKALVRKQK